MLSMISIGDCAMKCKYCLVAIGDYTCLAGRGDNDFIPITEDNIRKVMNEKEIKDYWSREGRAERIIEVLPQMKQEISEFMGT